MIRFAFAAFFLLFLTGLLVIGYLRTFSKGGLSRVWPSDEPARVSTPPVWWRYGDVSWRGYVRVIPFGGLVGGTFLVLEAWCFMLLTSFGQFQFVSNQAARDWLGWGLTIGFAGLVVSFLLSMSVFLFNQPKLLVPPGLRHQPGAIEVWRNRWRGRTDGHASHRT